LGEMYDEMLPS